MGRTAVLTASLSSRRPQYEIGKPDSQSHYVKRLLQERKRAVQAISVLANITTIIVTRRQHDMRV